MTDVIRPGAVSATPAPEGGIPLILPVDADVLGREIHRHLTPEHLVDGCVLCQTEIPSTFFISLKSCCGILLMDECECAAFAAEARGVFAHNPIMWDLRERRDV